MSSVKDEILRLQGYVKTYTTYKIECGICGESIIDKDTFKAEFAQKVYQKGFRKPVANDAVMCPECYKNYCSRRSHYDD